MRPIIDFENLKLELSSSDADRAFFIANIIRYHNDLIHLTKCYTPMGKSLLHLGTFPRQNFICRNKTEAEYRATLLKKLTPDALHLAIEVFHLARYCIEKLPVNEETFKLRTAYGTTFFDEGMCLFRQKRFKKASQNFSRALEIYKNKDRKWPASPNAELGIADCYLYLGECEVVLRNTRKACKNLKECLKLSKNLGVKDNIQRAKELLEKV